MNKQENRAEKARNMRYRKSALQTMGFNDINSGLYEIAEACSDVRYFVDDEDTLLAALDGDEEEAFEFKIAFADIEDKADKLFEAIRRNYDIEEYFDDCTVALIGNRFNVIGYDTVEEDYFALTNFEQELAHTEAGKRFMRKTKQEIIATVGQCVGILLAYVDLQQQYDNLKTEMNILRDDNMSLLQIVKSIEAAYNAAEKDGFYEYGKPTIEFNRLVAQMPDRAWIE